MCCNTVGSKEVTCILGKCRPRASACIPTCTRWTGVRCNSAVLLKLPFGWLALLDQRDVPLCMHLILVATEYLHHAYCTCTGTCVQLHLLPHCCLSLHALEEFRLNGFFVQDWIVTCVWARLRVSCVSFWAPARFPFGRLACLDDWNRMSHAPDLACFLCQVDADVCSVQSSGIGTVEDFRLVGLP
jgi:hypothetical protein